MRVGKASKKKKPSLEFRIGQEIWPVERDVLSRPDRLKYVRKLIKPEGCVFCEANKSEVSFERLLIYKSKHSMVVMNKYPYNNGHCLVLPRRHIGDLLKLTQDEYADLMNTLRMTVSVLQECYECPGLNVGLNHGACAGAGIPEHLHFHVIPRWAGDTNFFPLIADSKVVVESLEQSFDRLLPYFSKHAKRMKAKR